MHRGLAQELIWQGGKWVPGCLAPRAVAFASFCASLFSIFLTSAMSPCFKNTWIELYSGVRRERGSLARKVLLCGTTRAEPQSCPQTEDCTALPRPGRSCPPPHQPLHGHMLLHPPHRPTRAAFLPSLSCIQGSYGGTGLAAFASPSLVLPDSPAEWPPLRHFLALASQTAKGSGSLRAAMPSQLGPRGPAVRQAGHEAFGENESSVQPSASHLHS